MTKYPTRVVVVDDQAHIRESVRAFLCTFPDFDLAGEAADGFDWYRR